MTNTTGREMRFVGMDKPIIPINPYRWIPVTERLPEVYKLVLAVCKSGKIFVGEYVDLGWRTLWRIKTARDSTKEITQIVTHWMYLPEPPKGE